MIRAISLSIVYFALVALTFVNGQTKSCLIRDTRLASSDCSFCTMFNGNFSSALKSIIYWLGNTQETSTKNALFSELVRDTREESDVRRAAMSALAMSRSAATLPVLQNFFETLPARDLKQRALNGIARNDNSEVLIRTARSHPQMEVRKQAIRFLGQTGDERAVAFFRELLNK